VKGAVAAVARRGGWRERCRGGWRERCRGGLAVRGEVAVLVAAAVLAGAVVLAGCGESVELPDLFVVTRTGGREKLTVRINEGGEVHCNGGPAHQLSDPQLIQARGVTEELQTPSSKHLSLPPRPGSVFRYEVRDAEGTVRFADNSAHQPSALQHLQYLVLEVAQRVCGLPG
jgi:hypothetical protein